MRNRLTGILAVLAVACFALQANATVTTEKRSRDFTCSGGTSYAYDFPVLSVNDLAVTKYTGSCGSATYSTLAYGTGFTATRTSTGGTVTTIAACGEGYCLRVQRLVDYTQETSFRSQGNFSPAAHEAAFDKLTMEIIQVASGVSQSEDTALAIENHIASSDDHTMYFKLAGRSGGQVAYGGLLANQELHLGANALLDGGVVRILSDTQIDEGLIVAGTITAGYNLIANGGQLYGDNTSLSIDSGMALAGFLYLGADTLTVDEANGYVGIGDTTPDAELDVVGDALVSGTVTAEQLTSSDDATVTDDLAVGGDVAVTGSVTAATAVFPTIYGSTTAGQSLTLKPNSAAADGGIILGTTATFTASSGDLSLGVGDLVATAGWFTGSLTVDVNATVAGTVQGEQLTSTDDATITDDLGVGGDLAVTGTISGLRKMTHTSTNKNLPASVADCGGVWTTSTDGLVFTLANITASISGCELTMVDIAAAAAASISVVIDASDDIVGTCLDSSKAGATEADFFASGAHKGIYLSKATSVQGDKLVVIADSGNNYWHIVQCIGYWIVLP